MLDAASALEKFCAELGEGEFSLTISRKELLSRLVRLNAAKDAEEASSLLDVDEKRLLDTIFVKDWAVRYNVYTDTFHFVRLIPSDLLVRVAENYAKHLPDRLAESLERVTPRQFELLIGAVLNHRPDLRNVRVSPASRDGGIDFQALSQAADDVKPTLVIGQAKHWVGPVGAPEVQKLVGILAIKAKKGPVKGMFIALAGYTEPAIHVIEESPYPIETLAGNELVSLMIEVGVGANRIQITFPVYDSVFWNELNDL